jgi:erythronate-4-phosphate dehydrogenase
MTSREFLRVCQLNNKMIEQRVIYIDENIPLLAESLAGCGIIVRFNGRKLTNDDLKKSNCQYLFVRSTTKVNESLLEKSNVRFVGTATSGIDHIDTQYLKSKGIHFCSAPGANANSVAEYVLYSMIIYSKKHNVTLKDKTIGVVGFGNVGKIVARYANLMGLDVLVNDPPLHDDGFIFPDYVQYIGLNEICESADIITNHVPLTFSGKDKHPTNRLFNNDNIQKIKSGSLFIHTSRGGVADEEALLAKISRGEVIAAIDVFESEPLVNIELARSAILSTPHIAGYSRDGKIKGSLMMAQQFKNVTGAEPNMQPFKDELTNYSPMKESDFKDYEKIFDLIYNNRKLHEDHKRFLETLELNDTDRAKQFDILRKQYPVRRESL